jgi:hypothetical protein
LHSSKTGGVELLSVSMSVAVLELCCIIALGAA